MNYIVEVFDWVFAVAAVCVDVSLAWAASRMAKEVVVSQRGVFCCVDGNNIDFNSFVK